MIFSKKEADYINKEIEAYQSKADQVSLQGNDTQRVLAGQLTLIAATVVTLSAAFLKTDSSGVALGIHARWVLIASWIAFALSIASGITGLVLDGKYFMKWQRFFVEIAQRLGTSQYTSATISKAREGLVKPKDNSPFWPLYVQIGLLVIGGIAFLTLIIHLELK